MPVKILACIPAHNEASNIADVIKKAIKYVAEVVVYDDGSRDNTAEVAKAAGATLFREKSNRGYGFAIRRLFEIAKEKGADIVVTLDADGQHNADQIPDVVAPIVNEEGVDIVIGSRFVRVQDREKVPMYRSFGVKTITKVTQLGSYSHITDAESGFRAFSKNAFSKIEPIANRYSACAGMLLQAKEHNLVIKEVPVTINYDAVRSSHNPVSQGIGVLYGVIHFISIRHPLLFYGLAGIVLMAVAVFYTSNALELFAKTRYISTNMIILSVGAAVVGIVLLATGIILYSITALLKGRLKDG